MKILTISIAAYNVEKTLEKALDSLCQDEILDDIQILVVDDGSKDNTGLIASEYEEKYPQSVKYIKKENGGHGSTINKGMELATGKYFRILDGDDYVDSQAYIEYVKRLRECDDDMIITDFRCVNSIGETRIDPAVKENGKNVYDSLTDGKQYSFSDIKSTRIFGLSSVTIRTALLQEHKVNITEHCFYVDVEFIVWCIYLARDFVFWKLPVYMYLKEESGDNSVSKKNMIKNVDMQVTVVKKLCEEYENTFVHADDARNSLILKRIAISYGATIRTYMLLDNSKKSKVLIKAFDGKVKNETPHTYKRLNADRFIRLTRVGNYLLVPIIRAAYRRYITR